MLSARYGERRKSERVFESVDAKLEDDNRVLFE